MRKVFLLVCWLGVITGCQDYIFEGLPSSVIKEKRWTQTIQISTAADILFLIDNSGSMVGEQIQLGQSFGAFINEIEKYFGKDYHIAVVTTGVKSPQCPNCSEAQTCPDCVQNPTTDNCANCSNCMNIESGESGAFQRRLGKNVGTVVQPQFQFRLDDRCGQVITSDNIWCFYRDGEGIAMVGTNGCGYEKGLEALLLALTSANKGSGFLRENATLAIIAVTDEEDCGKVGETSEGLPPGGNICYYAANGQDPDGNTNDPNGLPYRLTPVEKYYEEFMKIKGNREGMVKFAAIVGVEDVQHPENTKIKFVKEGTKWKKIPACETPGCKEECAPYSSQPYLYNNCIEACEAFPGTRYIKLAQLFGGNGFIDTICQRDFSATMAKLGTFVGCPEVFKLSEPILDPGLANILINGKTVPRYSCAFQEKRLQECDGPSDTSCGAGVACVPTWEYHPPTNPPDPQAKGGTITFADHYDPCEYFNPGESVHIELVYVTP